MLTPEELQKQKQNFIDLLTETNRPGMDKLLAWLQTTDFFEAPASTRFHLNYEGGLLEHSLNVYYVLEQLSYLRYSPKTPTDFTIPKDTIIITALLHDICKANTYKKGQRWRKDANNRWEQYDVYEFKEDEPLGHGEKSIYLLQRAGLQLTEKEVYMIRWHMGGFEAQGNQMTLSAAMAKCPEIALIHSADIIASSIIENNDKESEEQENVKN